jgi:argininosuccinate lyase
MPQKRNPDAAELVRAKAGRIIGALTGLLVVLKGLPLAYGKDLQEDKEPAFDTADSLALSLDAMTGMIEDATFDAEAMRAAAAKGYATATDLADWLVRKLNMPFRKAHAAAGRLVRRAEGRSCALEDLSLAEMQAIVPGIEAGVFAVLGVENSVNSRTSFGGTAPANVRRSVRAARKRFLG